MLYISPAFRCFLTFLGVILDLKLPRILFTLLLRSERAWSERNSILICAAGQFFFTFWIAMQSGRTHAPHSDNFYDPPSKTNTVSAHSTILILVWVFFYFGRLGGSSFSLGDFYYYGPWDRHPSIAFGFSALFLPHPMRFPSPRLTKRDRYSPPLFIRP